MEELYKKYLSEPDDYDGVVSWIFLLEPATLGSEVKRALGSTAVNKLVDAMEFQYNYLNPQRMPSRCCICYVSKSGRPRSGHRT